MTQAGLMVYATTLAQAALGLILAIILLSFHRHYRRGYLLHWSWSWLALAIHQTGGILGLYLSGELAAAHPLRVSLTAISQAAGYLQVAWLLFGVIEFARGRPVRLRSQSIVVALAVATGLVSTFLFLTDPGAAVERYFTRVGLQSLVSALAFSVAAVAIIRSAEQHRTLGHRLLAGGFLLHGANQLFYFLAAASWLFRDEFVASSMYLGFSDLVFHGLIGLGMVTSLLEDERQAAIIAATEAEHLAYHDPLTGLPNRPLFLDRLIMALAQAERQNTKVAVLFCDLDRFKEINDSLGHSVGDELLRQVAQRIEKSVRGVDTVARFGGDEFTLIIQNLREPEAAATVARKILETLRAPFYSGGHELFIATSIGISTYPTDGRDLESLLKNADTAMYRAKEQGRDNFQLYTPAMNATALERLALENMLRRAVAQDELVLHYQPLIRIDDGGVFAAEALIRWNHPELGLIQPAQFIPTAEMSGLILPIGAWVLRTACAQMKEWQDLHGARLAVAVNLSARQFQQPDLIETIRDALDASGLDPACLELEITESYSMQNPDATVETLRELKTLGVRISMDDFGTGYSSLAYLKKFPIDTIKVDRSFVQDLGTDRDDEAITTAVIAMAQSLSLHVVAEGVENQVQLDFLRARTCDSVQGFFFSHPLPPAEFEQFISRSILGSRPRGPLQSE
jgi:diguanylate cyclase (GGDEF)-like protein